MASCFTELTDRHPRGVAIALPIRQEDLAAWTGASCAGTTKALQTLRQLGWIRTGRAEIIVQDSLALRRGGI